uniref:Uncharacterized protein n=1 Tax=Arundo donax TaxID=35708 RepID=A0A0A9BM55_ARUDO
MRYAFWHPPYCRLLANVLHFCMAVLLQL